VPKDAIKSYQVKASMSDHKRYQHQEEARQYLERVAKGYVFDSASGLHHTITGQHKSKVQKMSADKQKDKWFKTEVRRDWPILILNIATLIVIAYYTYVTLRRSPEMTHVCSPD
jgi:hypothetical protein